MPVAASSLSTGWLRPPPRTASVATALATVAPSRRGSSCGSTGPPVSRRTAGSTAIDSPSRTTPRSTGTRCSASRPGTRLLAPELTFTPPSGVRTAAAQYRSLCSRTPSRSAMPPSCTLMPFSPRSLVYVHAVCVHDFAYTLPQPRGPPLRRGKTARSGASPPHSVTRATGGAVRPVW